MKSKRAVTFAFVLISVCGAYFLVRAATPLGDVPPLPELAVVVGIGGVIILLAEICIRMDRRINRAPKRPYYLIDRIHGRCLALDADGSYETCQSVLKDLATTFGAQYSRHLDPGPSPASDKEHGYWKLFLFGQDFFLMRVRDDGICIWGPKPPADLAGFLRLADHFEAVEFATWQRRFLRLMKLQPPIRKTVTVGR